MKYVGYTLLLILFIYFVFIKPYIILHKIELKLEGVEINLQERGLKLREFLLFIPEFRDHTYFLRVEGLSLYRSRLEAKEISVITLSLKITEKPFDYDFTGLVRRLNKLNLSLEKAYVSVNSPATLESITVLVGHTHLSGRKIFSNSPAVVYYIRGNKSDRIEVLVKEAYLDGPTFNLVSAQVIGEKYSFNLAGVWRGKRGNFKATGLINEFSGKVFSIDPIKVEASGYVDYTNIKADLELQTEKLKIGNKFYANLKGTGKYIYSFRKKNHILLSLNGDNIKGSLEYNIKNNTLEFLLDKLAVDESLFYEKKDIEGTFSGKILIDLHNKSFRLEGDINNLAVDKIYIGTARIKSEANYGLTNNGIIEFSSELFDINGRFYEGDFAGRIRVKGFPYSEDRLSVKVFYEGDLYYSKGNLKSIGEGSALNLSLNGRNIGDLTFNLNFNNPNYQIIAKGYGFQISGTGSIAEKSFKGDIDLYGFSLKEGDLEISDLAGHVFAHIAGEKVDLNGKVEGKIKREGLELQSLSEFYFSGSEGKLSGKFFSYLKNIKYGEFEFKDGSLKGMIEDEEASFSYTIEDKLRGLGKISLKDFSFSTQGRWQGQIGESLLKISYTLESSGGLVVARAKGKAKIKDILIPVDANLQIRKDKLSATFKEFKTQKGILGIEFGRVSLEDEKISFEGASVKLNSEEIIKIYPGEGYFDFKTRKVEIPMINIRGYANGQARLSYNPISGFNLVSEGSIDLGKVSKLIRSKTQTTLLGSLYYYLNTDGAKLNLVFLSKEPIELRSRYLGLPLIGNAYFFGDGEVFKGSLNFAGNGSSLRMEAEGTEKRLTAEFRFDRIPVIYKDTSLRSNLLLKGWGNLETDYKSLRISSELSLGGVIDIRSFPKEKQYEKEEFGERISLNLKISSYEPLKVYLPEGYIYSFLDGYVRGRPNDLDYKIKLSLSGGELRYFNRKFYVKSGIYELDKKERKIDLAIASSLPEYVMLIELKGNPEYPKVLLRSEPPREPRQILADLISGGGRAEGLISIGDLLASQIPQLTGFSRGLERTLGTEVNISVSPHIGSSGEVGVSTKISKDITDKLSVEYQQSSIKNPKESYVGGDVKISSSTSLSGRINSDKSGEFKLRIRGKFGF